MCNINITKKIAKPFLLLQYNKFHIPWICNRSKMKIIERIILNNRPFFYISSVVFSLCLITLMRYCGMKFAIFRVLRSGKTGHASQTAEFDVAFGLY